MSYDFNRYKQDLERLIKLISDFEIKLKTVFQKYPATLLEERKELQKTLIYLEQITEREYTKLNFSHEALNRLNLMANLIDGKFNDYPQVRKKKEDIEKLIREILRNITTIHLSDHYPELRVKDFYDREGNIGLFQLALDGRNRFKLHDKLGHLFSELKHNKMVAEGYLSGFQRRNKDDKTRVVISQLMGLVPLIGGVMDEIGSSMEFACRLCAGVADDVGRDPKLRPSAIEQMRQVLIKVNQINDSIHDIESIIQSWIDSHSEIIGTFNMDYRMNDLSIR
jgi:hypothetical protein